MQLRIVPLFKDTYLKELPRHCVCIVRPPKYNMKISRNEITGAYYEAKLSWWRLSLAIFVGLGITLALIDWLVGPEVVTNWIADLLGSLMN